MQEVKRLNSKIGTATISKKCAALKLSFVLIFSLFLTRVASQETILTTGMDATGSEGSMSYSVGQFAYTTETGSTGLLLQGVQQAYEIFTVTGIENANIDLKVSAFPNPTKDYLTLTTNDIEFSDLNFQLFDTTGKLLQRKKIAGNQTAIDFSNYSVGIYFLKVIKGNTEIKLLKIIKK